MHIEDEGRFNTGRLTGFEGHHRVDAPCEINLVERVTSVREASRVSDAWVRGTAGAAHGWHRLEVKDGIVKNPITSVSSRAGPDQMPAGAPD